MESNKYQTIEGIPSEDVLEQLHAVCYSIFDYHNEETFDQRLSEKAMPCTILCYKESELIGFKLGYQLDPNTFYSWMGGVKPAFRERGIAKKLADMQLQWAKARGFIKIRTKSKNQFKPMMIFNLKQGFDIVGTEPGYQDQVKIIFEKTL